MPTIEELQAILDSEEPLRVEILLCRPDGSSQAVSAELMTVASKILTWREAGLVEDDSY